MGKLTHQNLVLSKFRHLGLFAVGCLHTEQSSEQEVVDFNFGVDIGEVAAETKHESDQAVSTAERGIDACSDTCSLLETSRKGSTIAYQ